jgi:hypothetical protein
MYKTVPITIQELQGLKKMLINIAEYLDTFYFWGMEPPWAIYTIICSLTKKNKKYVWYRGGDLNDFR